VPSRVAVPSLAAFRTNFSQRCPNVLQRLQPLLAAEPILIAGGSVLHALTAGDSTRTGKGGLWERDELGVRKSDVDLFLHATSPADASRICRDVYSALAVDDEIWIITRCRGVVNISDLQSQLTVQVVLRLYESPAEVLLGFDVDCACVGFDGTSVWALPRCLRALKHGVNVLNPLHAWPSRATYEYRLVKYASRGFALAVPGLDLQHVDLLAINQTELRDLRGLARLFKLVLSTTTATQMWKGEGGAERKRAIEIVDPLACALLDRRDFLDPGDHLLKDICGRGYDDHAGVIVPSVFQVNRIAGDDVDGATGVPDASMDAERLTGRYPDAIHFARDTRASVWAEIEDAGGEWHAAHAGEHGIRKLHDAWDTSKRSREYLNAADGDLEPRYYVHAAMARGSTVAALS